MKKRIEKEKENNHNRTVLQSLSLKDVYILHRLFCVSSYLMGFHVLPSVISFFSSSPNLSPPLLFLFPSPFSPLPPERGYKMPSKEAGSIAVTGCHGNTQISKTLSPLRMIQGQTLLRSEATAAPEISGLGEPEI